MKINGYSANVNVANSTLISSKEELLVNRTEQAQPKEQHHDIQQKAKKESEEDSELTKDDVKHIVKGINEFLQPQFTSIHFSLHEESDRYYVEVIDQKTQKILREIPEKELLDVYAKMTEYLGLFIDEKL